MWEAMEGWLRNETSGEHVFIGSTLGRQELAHRIARLLNAEEAQAHVLEALRMYHASAAVSYENARQLGLATCWEAAEKAIGEIDRLEK